MALDLEQLPQEIRSEVEAVMAEKDRLEKENRLLQQQLRLAYLLKFGRRSEKLSDNQLELLEQEASVTEGELQQEAGQEQKDQAELKNQKKKSKTRTKPHPGRMPLPPHLERKETIIGAHPDDCYCSQCQSEKPVIRYEITEELAVKPAEYYVEVKKQEVRACAKHPEEGVKTAPTPEKILPKSKLGDSVIIDAVLKKYTEHLPVYRQCAILDRDFGIELDRGTLTEAIMAAGDLLRPVSGAIAEDLRQGDYIQGDDTTVPCQSRRTVGKNHQAYLFEFGRPGGPVVFDFQMGRSRDGPKAFLANFEGYLQTDAYSVYTGMGGKGITLVGCMAHLRRGFWRAHELAKEDPRPLEVLGLIKELYALEEQARNKGLSWRERGQLRQEKSLPTAHRLKERIIALRQEPGVMPGTAFAKACDYALNHWEKIEPIFADGRLELDNNLCENSIRPLALGRKNWLHIGSETAGKKVAAIASVLETCRRLGINARDYLQDVLPQLGQWPINRVAELTPMAWAQGGSA